VSGAITTASVLTHRRPGETGPALRRLRDIAAEHAVVLRVSAEEADKHSLHRCPGIEVDGRADGVDMCFALGGDGTILTALRRYAGTAVPVFGVNFGEVGFLSTVDRDAAEEGFLRAFAGEVETLRLPAIGLDGRRPEQLAINDVSIQRRHGSRVADLGFSIGGEEVARVRCDGLVVATPAGSTGYNLANGGPVLAWGVEGFVVSFIAPHSLTARPLVVAPDDVLTLHNRSREEEVEVAADGRPAGVLAAGDRLEVRRSERSALLAQLSGTTFYGRLRQKFGRLASTA
jgi:NAD+ kinase